jgi:hypothetical protein
MEKIVGTDRLKNRNGRLAEEMHGVVRGKQYEING